MTSSWLLVLVPSAGTLSVGPGSHAKAFQHSDDPSVRADGSSAGTVILPVLAERFLGA